MNVPLAKYSVFLTPVAADLAYCHMLMGEICAVYESSPFEPHVTVYSGTFADHRELEAAVSAAIRGVEPILLTVRDIGCSEEYFKTLFIRFEENDVLQGMYRRIRQGLVVDSGYQLMPHLSLLYHDMPVTEKQALARRVHLDRSSILFDRVKIVTPRNFNEGWRDTRRWETVCSFRLDSAQGGGC